ncbi:MAG: hypothetical protein EU542_04315 [Promethearchaeota archaeon]|nr:MAG: hypothetical protein EU542_04315 [Candidatus Lokiarchaeota archaeon]
MDTDKNKNLLEKQLKAVGKKVRVDILKRLSTSQVPLTYSALQKDILGNNSNSSNFSFHLKTLKKNKLIENVEDGYLLTVLGRQILRNVLSIEQILNVQNKSIMIRTSKYSKEPFELRKVETYLINEGVMEPYQARQIAQEVEERLSKTKIEYLTAPLMREYINSILLENGLEKVRHRLTRLGTPPSEVSQYFKNSTLNPDLFIKTLGSQISEQYLLLNLLPNDLADLYLSGEIYLLHLNYWSLRPLSLYLNTSTLLEFIDKKNVPKGSSASFSLMKFFLGFSKSLGLLKPFFSEDLLLGNFDLLLDTLHENPEIRKRYYILLLSELIKFNSSYRDRRSHVSLNINSTSSGFIDEVFQFIKNKDDFAIPNFMIPYPESQTIAGALFESRLGSNLCFFNSVGSKLMNSTLNYINFPFNTSSVDNKILLDKILINFHDIALKSHQNDDVFLDLVQDRLYDTFEFFSYKKELIEKKFHNSKSWNKIISSFFKDGEKTWIHNSIKAISFFGLNKAIKLQCGIEIDRIEKSEKFALELLNLIKDIISEKNSDENESYCLNQPHEGSYLYENGKISNSYQHNKDNHIYSMDLIRKESKLSLEKRIKLFQKFEHLLEGGSIFNYYFDHNHKNLKEDIEKIINSNVSAFSIKFD